MTKKKVMKIVVALLVAVLLTMTFSQLAFANSVDRDISTDYFDDGDRSNASKAAGNIIGAIINIAQVIGMGVAIIMLIVLAIQYIAASPEGKAEIKKNSTIYIVGAIILFAASGILQIVKRFAQSNISDNG